MHKRWISCPADSISECARRSSFELDCLLVDGVKWEPTKLLEFLQYSTKLGVLSLIECDLDYGTVLRAMKRVGESDTEENQPLLPNLETLEFLANWNDEQLPVQNNHSNLRVTPEEIVDTLESRWDRDRHHGADHISPRLKAMHLILPPPLDTFDLYNQKSMETIARLREEGMKLTLTVEEHAMLQDDDLGWSM
ncbi:hypothetical protein BDN72DRAFT_849284 [Pluteus cervinus]|uniref:Uncharacterized protein n=1 Tax=Pluteus cervinus TaxID=181527 RepID=A0ACD3AAM5_9AGAR|nr:hypothetical protein BDN72DRAFT_849284 [Pluteus cervinus]